MAAGTYRVTDPSKSTHKQSSRARVWVISHRDQDRFFSPDVTFGDTVTPSERSKITTEKKSDKLQQLLAANPQDFINKILTSTDAVVEMSNDVIEFDFTKAISNPVGTFSMMLVPREEYLHTLDSDDLLIVELSNGLEPSSVVSVLLIDKVRKQRKALGNYSTVDRILVTGQDLAKVIVETSVFVDSSPAFFQVDVTKFLDSFRQTSPGQKLGFSAKAEEIIPALLQAFSRLQIQGPTGSSEARQFTSSLGQTKPLQQFVFPGDIGVNMIDLIDTTPVGKGGFVGTTVGALANFEIPQESVTLWSLIEQYSNRLVNEMFFDLREVDPKKITNTTLVPTQSLGSSKKSYRYSLIFRQQPFDHDAFEALKTHEVEDHEVLETDIGKSSHNVMNAFRVWLFNHNIPSLAEKGWPSVFNLESIAKHGLKRYEPQSNYPWPDLQSASDPSNSKDAAAQQTAFDVANRYLKRIVAWNAANEEFLEGSITMRLRPDIRIGERIRLYTFDGSVTNFYVEAITHSFRFPGLSTTTVTVTHGTPLQILNRKTNVAINRLYLDNIKSIGRTFITYSYFGEKKISIFGGEAEAPLNDDLAVSSPAPPVPTTPVAVSTRNVIANEKTKNYIKKLCEKYGSNTGSPAITAAVLYGLVGRESSFGKNTFNSITGAAGITQIVPGTATDYGVTTAQLLQDDDLAVKIAAQVLKDYRTSLSAYVNPVSMDYVLAAYNKGIGRAATYINLYVKGVPPNSGPFTIPLTPDQKVAFEAALRGAYATPIISYADHYTPPSEA